MNRVILSGEIGSDIVLKKTTTGQSLCNFSIEVKEKGKDGQERKYFFDCTAWGENAEHINQYGFRGQHIAVDGKLKRCSRVDCNECEFNPGANKGCKQRLIEWLRKPYEKPTNKLTQFEYDLLQSYSDIYSFNAFNSLSGMKEKGYFKGIDDNKTIGDILDNCEVME